MKSTAPIALAIALCCCGAVGQASVRPGALPDHSDPDWPCIQRKVPELSVVAVWSGPPVDAAFANWRGDEEVAPLVSQLAARRLPLDEARAAISSYAQGLAPERKSEQLTELFAGLFQTLNSERSDVIAGIERYGRKQKELAEQIRGDRSRVNEVEGDPQTSQELQNRLVWETRIFNERQAALSFVCEVPTIIEQRLFTLARAIGDELAS